MNIFTENRGLRLGWKLDTITDEPLGLTRPLWRNRLARSAVNRKVGGSSPPRDDSVFLHNTLFDTRAICNTLLGKSFQKKETEPATLSETFLVNLHIPVIKWLYSHVSPMSKPSVFCWVFCVSFTFIRKKKTKTKNRKRVVTTYNDYLFLSYNVNFPHENVFPHRESNPGHRRERPGS